MGLYLCIFDSDEEVDGVEVGSYADFNALRDYIVHELEKDNAGSRFPTFVLHSDCDGEWTPVECDHLKSELAEITCEVGVLPPVEFQSEWQRVVAKSIGLEPKSAFASFIDVDGEYLIDRLQSLAHTASRRRLPIVFQ